MRPRFVGSLYVVRIREARGVFGRTRWRLRAPLSYESRALVSPLNGVGIVTVPAGYETDFASVPRLPISFAIAGDTAHEAAVVHDYLYTTPLLGVTRSRADAVFYEAMRASGVPCWRALVMWLAVRAFGWLAFTRR